MSRLAFSSRRPRTRARLGATLLLLIAITLGLTGLDVPAFAAAPAAPTLIGPASGSTSAAATPTLSVSATDPDGGSLDVSFEGRKAGVTVPGQPTGQPFSLVVLPDTQNYTYSDRQATIRQQAQWAVDTRSSLNTAMVVQLGDLVSNFDNPTQWGYASDGLKVLDDAKMPNSVLPGNHDFDNASEDFSFYNSYFPVSRYRNAAWTPSTASYGGYMGQSQFGTDPVDRQNMNNYVLFSAAGRDYLVLNLEFEPPRSVYDWADRVLRAYPDRTAILATHSFVSITGTRRTTFSRTNGTSPATMWSDLVANHCSIRLVLSGHEHNGDAGEARRTDANNCGVQVPQILTDYQDRANGGDGWLRYYTFDPTANTMTATTYSPKLNRYETDADSSFTVPFEVTPGTPAPFAPIATRTISSGGTATSTWTGLEPDTTYEWRAVARDADSSVTSPTWTIRTPPATVAVEDGFDRTVSGGWGEAPGGRPWSVSTGSAFAVGQSAGTIGVPAGVTRRAQLPGVTSVDSRVSADFSAGSAVGGSGLYVSLLARINAGADYRAKTQIDPNGALSLSLVRYNGGETSLASKTLTTLGTLSPGSKLRVVLEAAGTAPTTLRAKVWKVGSAEPVSWTLTATDGTAALQNAGSSGLEVYASSRATAATTVAVDRYGFSGLDQPPANAAPTAVIATPTISERTVGLDGSGSTDPDGTIAGFAWDFGDGSTATGATTSHRYSADGTYRVTLTVTDAAGATASASKDVAVAASPAPSALASDDFGRTVASGWGSADRGGAWTTSGPAGAFAVGGGAATQQLVTKGTSAEASLRSATAAGTELRAVVAWDRTPAAGTQYTSFVVRAVSSGTDYRLKVIGNATGSPAMEVIRRVNGAETVLSRTSLTQTSFAANTRYAVAVRVSTSAGSTAVSGRLWPAGGTEPTSWQVSGTDTTAALQTAGWTGLGSYLSSGASKASTTSFSQLRVTVV